MHIEVNGQRRTVTEGTSIAQMLDELQLDPRTLAVERNLELVPRADHSATILVEGDRLEVVTLVGGG